MASETHKATIWIPGVGITIANVNKDDEFVAARLNGVHVFSRYASRNRTKDEYSNILARIEDAIRSITPGTPIIVAGDFNA